MVLKGYLAWATILALLISALAPRDMRLWNGPQIWDIVGKIEEGEKR
jgi:hypothetical protein